MNSSQKERPNNPSSLPHSLLPAYYNSLDFSNEIVNTCSFCILKDSIKTYHSALSDLSVILTWNILEAAGIFIKIINRTVLSGELPNKGPSGRRHIQDMFPAYNHTLLYLLLSEIHERDYDIQNDKPCCLQRLPISLK